MTGHLSFPELKDGQTNHSDWTQLCIRYIPAKLSDCGLEDLSIFAYIFAQWTQTCKVENEPAEFVADILDTMVQVASAILAQANSTQRVQNGQDWILQLWFKDGILSERFGPEIGRAHV